MNKSLKKLCSVQAAALLLSPAAVFAQDAVEEESPHELSANAALSTDYRFRGISQTTEDVAFSGGFDYSYTPIGFYAGVWASSIDFGEDTSANPLLEDDADLEIDFYGGFAGAFADTGIGWDVGGLYYSYPGSDTGDGVDDFDYFEAYGSLSYEMGPVAITGGLNYSPDYFFESDDAVYYYGDFSVTLPLGLSFSGHIGHQEIDDNAQFGTPDYTDWSIMLASWNIRQFTLSLSYIDTDLDEDECFGGTDFCDATAVFTISTGF